MRTAAGRPKGVLIGPKTSKMRLLGSSRETVFFEDYVLRKSLVRPGRKIKKEIPVRS
jgi:hypothetical protein